MEDKNFFTSIVFFCCEELKAQPEMIRSIEVIAKLSFLKMKPILEMLEKLEL